jgi:catechol 2,3-dioxygenase-like lactoylglutathione lyase family enzyme
MGAKVTGLGHVGIYVDDVQKMVDFYTGVLGMTLTDRGTGDRGVFLSCRPEQEHHEFVFAKAPEGQKTLAQQISFTVESLQDWRELHGRIVGAGCSVDRLVNHGIAFGCYFRDPEDNRIEVYWSTGKDYPQPHGDPIDMAKSDQELLEMLANMPPKEANKPHMYGEDVGKRLVATPASN